jgi:hypothetical protein
MAASPRRSPDHNVRAAVRRRSALRERLIVCALVAAALATAAAAVYAIVLNRP